MNNNVFDNKGLMINGISLDPQQWSVTLNSKNIVGDVSASNTSDKSNTTTNNNTGIVINGLTSISGEEKPKSKKKKLKKIIIGIVITIIILVISLFFIIRYSDVAYAHDYDKNEYVPYGFVDSEEETEQNALYCNDFLM